MIALIFAATILGQTSLQAEAPALINQASIRVAGASGALHYTIAECIGVYPMARSEPDVRAALESLDTLSMGVYDTTRKQAEAQMYALGAAQGRASPPSVADCANMLRNTGVNLSQAVRGYEGLIRELARR